MFRLPRRTTAFASAAALLVVVRYQAEGQNRATSQVQAIRFWSFGDVTRVAVQTNGNYTLTSDQIEHPSRVYFDLNGLRPPSAAHHGVETIHIGDPRIKEIRVAEVRPGKTRIVFDLECPVEVVSSQLVNPDRLMIEIRPKGTTLPELATAHSFTGSQKIDLSSGGTTAAQTSNVEQQNSARSSAATSTINPVTKPPVEVAHNITNHRATVIPTTAVPSRAGPNRAEPDPPNARMTSASSSAPVLGKPADLQSLSAAIKKESQDHSLVRVFGLKLGRVVIDAGHGGHDTGTIGPNGLMEKDLVLDVALRLGKLITQRLGAEVVYTRSDDTFIPLEERTKIANAEKADLFISIHANSSPAPSATGVETYYFNFTSDKHALALATRENATATSSISDLNDLLHRAVLQTKMDESREFAQRVQAALWKMSVKMNSQSRDRGVREAPFVVLIGATMPSILAEIGFVSNRHDSNLMKRASQREKIAEALFKGISEYASTLNHLQMARAGSE